MQELWTLLCAAQVTARGTAALLLFAEADGRGRSGAAHGGAPSVLELRLRHLPAAAPRLPPQEVAPRWGALLLGATELPWPPGAAACAQCGSPGGAEPGPDPAGDPRKDPRAGSAGAGAEEVLRCEFVLEAGGEGDAPRSTVFVRLLGPFAARAGEPLVLCWRLERGGAPLQAARCGFFA